MIDVDVWVRGASGAVTQKMKGVSADADAWTVADVKLLLEQMLKAIDRSRDPNSDPPAVSLRGFSWIVSPDQGWRAGAPGTAVGDGQCGALRHRRSAPVRDDHARDWWSARIPSGALT